MAYSDFKRKDLKEKFGITFQFAPLFKTVAAIPPSEVLLKNLEIGQLAGFVTEKARSERLVTPILMELLNNNDLNFTIYSGMNLDIDTQQGLNGECDFVLSHSSDQYAITTPVFTIVEAKKQDIEGGTIQCTAQLIGAQKLNDLDNTPLSSPIYGCSTTGTEWRFLKLEDTLVTIDRCPYYLAQPDQLLGVLQAIIEQTKPTSENDLTVKM